MTILEEEEKKKKTPAASLLVDETLVSKIRSLRLSVPKATLAER